MKPIQFFAGLLILSLCSLSAFSQQAPNQLKIRKIIVNGSSEMEVDPDQIYVNFQLREYHDSRKQKIGIDVIKKEFLEACAKAGVPKESIRVEGMGGHGYDEWFIRKRKKDPDFMATITYVILFANTKGIDDLVPRLNDEAVLNMYISKVSHSRMEDLRKEVKIKATQAARDKAVYMATSINEKVGPALLIEEIDQGVVYPMMMKSNVAMMEMTDSTQPYGGETSMPFEKIKLRFETRCEFELL